MWLVGLLLLGLAALFPLWAIATIQGHARRLNELAARIAELEARLARQSTLEAVPPPPAEASPPPEPIPMTRAATAEPPPPVAPPPAAPVAPAPPAPAPRGGLTLEQLVGGVWLQNVGSVLLLFGAFFLILWGYTTGRLGPGLLVAAGVAVGLGFVWRGDRMARTVAGFGHALIGIGLGIVYLSLYLGHFTLDALPSAAAFPMLTLVALGSIVVGLHYGVQGIAVLGLIGAFVPQILAGTLPMRGFSMTPAALLGYMALVDAVAFALAARAGWSVLDLTALGFTAITWIASGPKTPWSWGLEAGVAALFALLGLAPLPRLVAVEGRVGVGALAVIAIAPLCLIACSWPFLAYANTQVSAAFLTVLAILYLLAALWVDVRRPERDLWRPLTAAATLFLTAALQRALGNEHTPMAWAIEGAVLVELGLTPGRGWLRFLGYVLLLIDAFWLFVGFSMAAFSAAGQAFFDAGAIRDLIVIAAMIWTGLRLGARRAALGIDERYAAEAWGLIASGLLMLWSATEARDFARSLERGRLPVPESVGGVPLARRVDTLASVLTSAAWTVQAVATFALGWLRSSAFLRWVGMGLLGLTVLKFLAVDLQQVDVFWRFLTAIAVGAVLLAVSYVYQRRPRDRASSGPPPA